MHPIVTDADLDLLFAAPLAVLYKHSPICPTSDVAYEEMLAFRRRRAVPVYMVDVIHHRPLSRALASASAYAMRRPRRSFSGTASRPGTARTTRSRPRRWRGSWMT